MCIVSSQFTSMVQILSDLIIGTSAILKTSPYNSSSVCLVFYDFVTKAVQNIKNLKFLAVR